MNELTTTKSIGAFLASARKRITPETVGLPNTRRRRTPGLRREEVAELANIGVSWYTAIEQGKNVHPSLQVLESIAAALQLTAAEKSYLFGLANLSEVQSTQENTELSVGMTRMVDALDPNPVYVIDQYWNILYWNQAADFIFKLSHETNAPNLLEHFLLNEHMKQLITDWQKYAEIMVDRYRADKAKYPHDEKFQATIDALQKESSLFAKKWAEETITIPTDSYKDWQHPEIGAVAFDHMNLLSSELPNYTIKLFMADDSTKVKIENSLR
ncbi:helix-turn-helix transcriptional regulator [Enterococcus sp.]|uniref:helix-turn-helix transcriptional regulator n=1 Tax=Enterococcus sp. TaxID=35783 RepID=UPI00290A8FA8|nr:helix-turn-helix transcriptional regulator [Enterococcus sp.]MDU5336644.1 helix-turn-helix transcriptional regulator [Enterococcus sp.]